MAIDSLMAQLMTGLREKGPVDMGSSDPGRTGSRTVFHDDAYRIDKDRSYEGYSPGFPETLDLRYEGDSKFKGNDKMSKVVGPVESGDIVMRNSEVPVGAAAILNKMVNKNTAGMYKLPEADKEMPGFMKAASKNLAQSDMSGIMAGELLRQGFDPNMIRSLDRDGIIKLYEQTFGSERDADEMVKGPEPSDFRTILRLLQEGFSMDAIQEMMQDNTEQQAKVMFPGNYTERGQNVKVLPTNLKTNPDVPETSLAYITDQEAEMLKMLNPDTPHVGPEGIPTYDSLDYVAAPSTPKPTGATQSSFDAVAQGGGTQQQQDFVQQFQDSAQSATEGQSFMDAVQADIDQGAPSASLEQAIRETGARKKIETDPNATGNLTALADAGLLDDLMNLAGTAGSIPGLMFKGADALAAFLDAKERQGVEDLFSGDVSDVGGGLGNVLRALKDDPDRANYYFDKYEDELEKALGQGSLEGAEGKKKLTGTAEEKVQALIDKYTGNDKFDKAYNPQGYFFDETGKFKKGKEPRSASDYKELAELQAQGKIKFTRGNTQAIEEGRRLLEQDRGSSNQVSRPAGMGATETVPETVTAQPDERAGKFDVGGTMPYKDDVRTAGVEMDVPLGRRFTIDDSGKFRSGKGMDLNEAMKYATMGGYSQLEPFQEYLARRRKFLGEEEPKYFDEEGNVIFGGMEA